MSIHVDDFYVIYNDNDFADKLMDRLKREYGVITRKADDVISYLGMQVTKDRDGTVTLTQPGYVDSIMKDLGLDENSPGVDTPYEVKEYKKTGDDDPVSKHDYLELLGKINYLAVLTRGDILYALSRCAQRCSKPTRGDMNRLKRVCRYVNCTRHVGLIFVKDNKIELRCYVDGSHGCYEDGKGHFGYCFSLGPDDGCFYARSQKMKIVTLSSFETEYVAICEAVTEIVHLRNLLEDIGFRQEDPSIVYEDNQSVIAAISGKMNHQRTKHINIKYQYTREQAKQGVITVKYLETERMTADLLTKALPKKQHKKLTQKLLNCVM
jgi:hypothetical protein